MEMKNSEQLNFSANAFRVHFSGSSFLRRCISIMSSSVKLYCFRFLGVRGGMYLTSSYGWASFRICLLSFSGRNAAGVSYGDGAAGAGL